MNIIDHLDLIDRLVSEKASPSEIRGHVLAIREQIEAYQKEAEGRELEEGMDKLTIAALHLKIMALETKYP